MLRIGVLCPSEIAYRRFLPALKQIGNVELVGVGVNSPEERYGENYQNELEVSAMLSSEKEKATKMITEYGGRMFESYKSLIVSDNVDAIYIPLPPALHFQWAKYALENGKHVLVEKPATISLKNTTELVEIAHKNNLALHENYMFIFHDQLLQIDDIIKCGEIGDIRLYRISFGFPRRDLNDFRYNKSLGGGALIDAGGYTIKYATRLLGESVQIKCAKLNNVDGFDVDIYGSATLVNNDGVTAQIAFGMDNDYKCELEVWGSEGTIKTGRVLTAPAGFVPTVSIKKNTKIEERPLLADDSFKKSIEHFIKCMSDDDTRFKNYNEIMKQAHMVDEFLEMAKR